MNIRFVKRTDIDELIILCQAHATYEKVAFDIKNKATPLAKYLFDEKAGIHCLVVEKNNALVGYSTYVMQFSTWDVEYYTYIDCLYLKEEIRGHGIGKKVMNHIRQHALQEGCSTVQWQTPNFNTNAIRFYKNLGAISKSKERFYWTF